MIQDFSNKEIESAKDSIQNQIVCLADDYLSNHSTLVEDKLDGYDGCSVIRKVWKESDIEEAIKLAKQTLIELIQKGQFSF